MILMDNFTKHLKKKFTSISHNLFKKIEEETLPISFYEASITLNAKTRQSQHKKQTKLYLMNLDAKNLDKILSN